MPMSRETSGKQATLRNLNDESYRTLVNADDFALRPANFAVDVRKRRRVQRELDVALNVVNRVSAREQIRHVLWIYGGAVAGRNVGKLFRVGDVQLHDDRANLWEIFGQPFPRSIVAARDKFNSRVGNSLRDNDRIFIFARPTN